MKLEPRAPYVRSEFDACRPDEPGCPLCWNNDLLAGGIVLAEGEIFYVFTRTKNGRPIESFIATKEHHPDMTSLPPTWGEEFGKFYRLILDTYGIAEHNAYWNEGYAAGQRVGGHWHVKISPAPPEGTPTWGKGLSLLREESIHPPSD